MRSLQNKAGWVAAGLVGALPAVADDTWLLSAGADVDEESGYRLNLGVNWSPSEATLWSLAAGRARTDSDFGEFNHTQLLLGFDHLFDRVGVSGHARRSDESDLLTAHTLGGSVYFKGEAWRLSLHGEKRDSEFDPFGFNTTIPVRGTGGVVTMVPVSGVADCSLDNTGYGLSLSRSSGPWFVAATGMGYNYSGNACGISNLVLPAQVPELPVLTRDIFRRIAAQALNASGQLIGSQLTRENGLLDTSLSLGVQYRQGVRTWGVDYYRDREEFAGLESNTLVGSLTIPAGRADVEFRLGATDGDLTGTVGFAGVMFYVYVGGN